LPRVEPASRLVAATRQPSGIFPPDAKENLMAARQPARLRRALTICALALTGLLAARPAAAAGEEPSAEIVPSTREDGRDLYRLTYAGNEPALVAIEGKGIDALQLLVTDASGRPACSARRDGSRLLCEWHPQTTQEFLIEVRNPGRRPQPYRLWTN
jgi:hypothetical protein